MPRRALWNGSIDFGLVSIPVGLFPAESADEIEFHMLDPKDLSPIGYKVVSKRTGREIPRSELVKGYEYAKGRYVVVTEADLKRANSEATRSLTITDFVDLASIDPRYFDRPYYVAPLARGAHAYAVLREALARSGKAAIARLVIRTREHIATLFPEGHVIVVDLLRFAHELEDLGKVDIPADRHKPTAAELDMADKLIDSMVGEWKPEKYKDRYRADLEKLLERKGKGKLPEADEATEPEEKKGEVLDLMSLLKQSVEGKGKAAGERKGPRRAPRKGARRARRRSA